MYSAENYFWGWAAYSAGVACLLLCLWFFIRGLANRIIKQIILLVCAIVLLTPVESHRDDPHLAPAIAVSVFEASTQSGTENGFQRSFAPVLALTVLVLSVFIVVRLILAKIGKRPPVSDRPVNSSDKRRRSNI